MKKIVLVLLVACLLAFMTACKKTYSTPNDYHMIYDNVTEANKTFIKEGKKGTLLGWGEYSYCSYLMLFPREQPEKLTTFEYYWMQLMDYDGYAIYFTYTLDEQEYADFSKQIADFTISYGRQENRPVFTKDLFEYPTYILSWSDEVAGSGFCEYIMLDDETHTVVNVYKMFCPLEDVQAKADYNILPKNNDYEAVSKLLGGGTIHFAKHTGYSVYAFEDQENALFVPAQEELTYNCSFLDDV